MSDYSISVVIPALNEGDGIGLLVDSLLSVEVIVVDGGSRDETFVCAQAACAGKGMVLVSEPGRAIQMNHGAAQASGDVLVFLHADTKLPENFHAVMTKFWQSKSGWGRFDVQLSGASWQFRIIEWMINLRSTVSGICTGDQTIIVRRQIFEDAGRFPEIPLMEDIEISKQLKKKCWPWRAPGRVITSSRRWEQKGIYRTIVLMWRLRLAYFFGASAESLAARYRS